MNRINEFDIEPGVYKENTSEWHVVVLDIVTHHFTIHPDNGRLTVDSNVLVLFRELEQRAEQGYQRMTISVPDFNQKFIKT